MLESCHLAIRDVSNFYSSCTHSFKSACKKIGPVQAGCGAILVGGFPFCCNIREWLIFSLHASSVFRLRATRKKKSFAVFCLCDHGDFPAVCSSCVSLEPEWNGAIASCNIGQYRLLLLRQTDSCGCLDFMHIFNSRLLTARVTRKASIRPQHQLTSPVFSLEKLYQRQPSTTTNTIKHAAKTICLNPSSTPTNQSFRLQQHQQRQRTTTLRKHTLLHFI